MKWLAQLPLSSEHEQNKKNKQMSLIFATKELKITKE